MRKLLTAFVRFFISFPEVRQLLADSLRPYLRNNHTRTGFTLAASDEVALPVRQEYTIFTAAMTRETCGLFDISALRPGDSLLVRLYMPVRGTERLAEIWSIDYNGEMPPCYSIETCLLPAGSRVTVEQKTGVSRLLRYDFYVNRG